VWRQYKAYINYLKDGFWKVTNFKIKVVEEEIKMLLVWH